MCEANRNGTDVEVPDTKRQVPVLHVFLDEDHIALQKDKAGRKSTIIPVGVVAEGVFKEGRDPDGDGRRRLLNPTSFVPPDLKSKTLVDEIDAFIETTYDLCALKKIVVHGDGAGWISKALDDTAGTVVHALDGFHLQRELRHFAGRFTETKKERNKLRRKLENALSANDKEEFERIVMECSDSTADQTLKDKSAKFLKFIMKNWRAAAARMDKDVSVLGSCTESIVQHTLYCRMSTDPLSWSVRGASVISTWRVARLNGMDLLQSAPQSGQENPYTKHIQELAEKTAAQPLNWDIFSPAQEPFDCNSGTQHLIRLITAEQNVAAV